MKIYTVRDCIIWFKRFHVFLFNKKLGEGASSKGFFILVKILLFLVQKISYLVSLLLLIIFDKNFHLMR